MTKVFSSVREAWNGIRSGTIVPTRSNARRRVSCTANIQAQAQDVDTSGTSRGTSLSAYISGNDDDEHFEYSVDVKLADEDDAIAAASNHKEVDVSVLSDEDLRKLKRDDPFLYYSIPSVRRLSYRFHDEDEINTSISSRNNTNGRANRQRRTSLPAALLAMADNHIDQSRQRQQMQQEQEVPIMMQEPRRDSVVRKKRLSTEAHPTLVCDDLMRELRELAESDSEEDDLGLLDMELDDF